MSTVKYQIRYFWDEEYHIAEVTTESGKQTARLLALDIAKSRHHYPYGKLKIMSEEEVDNEKR